MGRRSKRHCSTRHAVKTKESEVDWKRTKARKRTHRISGIKPWRFVPSKTKMHIEGQFHRSNLNWSSNTLRIAFILGLLLLFSSKQSSSRFIFLSRFIHLFGVMRNLYFLVALFNQIHRSGVLNERIISPIYMAV